MVLWTSSSFTYFFPFSPTCTSNPRRNIINSPNLCSIITLSTPTRQISNLEKYDSSSHLSLSFSYLCGTICYLRHVLHELLRTLYHLLQTSLLRPLDPDCSQLAAATGDPAKSCVMAKTTRRRDTQSLCQCAFRNCLGRFISSDRRLYTLHCN